MTMSSSDVIEFLTNQILNDKTNNYLIDLLNIEEMELIKEFLLKNPELSVSSTFEGFGQITTSRNTVYDCRFDSIDSLLNAKPRLQFAVEPGGTYETIHVLNLQGISDIRKLEGINEAVLRAGHYRNNFMLYTTEELLKTFRATSGAYLDDRNDLLLLRKNLYF